MKVLTNSIPIKDNKVPIINFEWLFALSLQYLFECQFIKLSTRLNTATTILTTYQYKNSISIIQQDSDSELYSNFSVKQTVLSTRIYIYQSNHYKDFLHSPYSYFSRTRIPYYGTEKVLKKSFNRKNTVLYRKSKSLRKVFLALNFVWREKG